MKEPCMSVPLYKDWPVKSRDPLDLVKGHPESSILRGFYKQAMKEWLRAELVPCSRCGEPVGIIIGERVGK